MLPWLLTAGVAAGIVAGMCGKLSWVFDLAAHFRVQYAYAAALLIGWFVMIKSWRGAVVAGLVMVFALSGIFSLMSKPPAPSEAAKRETIRVLLANVNTKNQRYDRVLTVVADEKPAVVLLLEISQAWIDGLAELRKTHPHSRLVPRADNFGIGIYSALPLKNIVVDDLVGSVPAIVATVVHAGRDLTFYVAHSFPPVGGRATKERDSQLAAIATRARGLLEGDAKSLVLAGDFNITPWSPVWGDFVEDSGLLDSTMGFGPQATWPTRVPGFCRIPIDHCLHSADLEVVDRRLGPKFGSDHLPVIIDLR